MLKKLIDFFLKKPVSAIVEIDRSVILERRISWWVATIKISLDDIEYHKIKLSPHPRNEDDMYYYQLVDFPKYIFYIYSYVEYGETLYNVMINIPSLQGETITERSIKAREQLDAPGPVV